MDFSLIADDEMFVDIEGYEGRYSVSNYGRVYSHFRKGKIMNQYVGTNGYLMIGLRIGKKLKNVLVHSLILTAFNGSRPINFQCDHIDRNRQNNILNNLRWVDTSTQNINKKVQDRNITGEKNINIIYEKRVAGYYYDIRIRRNKKIVFNKRLNIKNYTLADAIKVRDEFLNA